MTPILTPDLMPHKVQVELSSHVLKQLLKSGLLHAEDFTCLNATAKQIIWQTLLVSSTDTTEDNLCA